MKNRIKYVAVLLLILPFSSCYEDKGNYAYTEVGAMKVTYEKSSSMRSIMIGNELEVIPEIDIKGFKPENLEYSWDLSIETVKNPEMKVLSTDRIFKEIINEPANKYDLRLTITDKGTGIKAYGMYKLTVLSYTTRCFLLLCKAPNGEFDISAAPISSMRGEVGQNLYSMANGGKTLKDVTKLVYLNNIYSEQFLYVFQKDGGCTISPIDLSYFGNADSWFFEAPEVIKPTNMYGDTDGKDYFLISDGGIYYIDNSLRPPFKARLREKMNDGKEYHCTSASLIRNSRKKMRYAFWDALNNRFLQWEMGTKKLVTIDAVKDAFDPNTIPADQKPIYLGDGYPDHAYNFFKDAAGEIHMYVFKNTAGSYDVNIIPEKYQKLPNSLELAKASSICPSRKLNLIYYSIDNVIYCFEPATNTRFEFYRDTDTNMKFLELYSIDRYDGTVYAAANSGTNGYFYRFYTTGSGELASPTEEDPDILDKVGPYSNITEMEYLLKDY